MATKRTAKVLHVSVKYGGAVKLEGDEKYTNLDNRKREDLLPKLQQYKPGDTITILLNDGGYIIGINGDDEPVTEKSSPVVQKYTPERTQFLIIRQTSLKAAVDFAVTRGVVEAQTIDDVLATADRFVAWIVDEEGWCPF